MVVRAIEEKWTPRTLAQFWGEFKRANEMQRTFADSVCGQIAEWL